MPQSDDMAVDTKTLPTTDLASQDGQKEKPLKSPCVSICALNEDDVCVGCYRTGTEISHWGSYSNEQRRQVLALSYQRAKACNPFLS